MKRNLKIAAAFLAAAIMMVASCNKKAEAQDNSGAAGKAETAAKNAKPNPESDFEIKIADDLSFVSVTGYKGKSNKIVVPETIQGLPVMYVSLVAPDATLLVIPSTAKLIDVSVGRDLKKGKYADVVLPEGLLAIKIRGRISSVVLPSTVKYIGSMSYSDEYSYYLITKELVLPPSLEFIGRCALTGHNYETQEGIDNLTLPVPSGKLFLQGQSIYCKNLPNLPESLENYRTYVDFDEIIRRSSGPGCKIGDIVLGPWQDKVNQSVELKKKFDLTRMVSSATYEEALEFDRNTKATLAPLPKELRKLIWKIFPQPKY